MTNKTLRALLVALLLTAGACMWNLPLAGQQESARYASLTPPPGKGLLYVLRLDEVEGGGIMSLVKLDGRNFGIVRGGVYLVAALEPGRHTVSSMLDKGQELSLDIQEGKTYYAAHFLRVTYSTRHARLKRLSPEEGRALLKGYRLSGKNYFQDTVE